MAQNKKPYYIIVAFMLIMLGIVWLLKADKPVEVEAGERIEGSECAETVAGWEIAPVQPETDRFVDVNKMTAQTCGEMTPEQLAEESYYDDLELLAICVEAEAGNQGLEGKRLVADVILNRVDDATGTWGNTIREVITEPGQFSSYWDGGMEKIQEASEETYHAVQMETAERGYPGIYYFREGTWSEYGTPWKKVGNHYFSGK